MIVHPSELIQEELDERGWTRDDLALRMGGATSLNRLTLDMYFDVGPNEPNLLLGEETSRQLAKAFGVSPKFFLDLHSAWRDSL